MNLYKISIIYMHEKKENSVKSCIETKDRVINTKLYDMKNTIYKRIMLAFNM